MDTAMMLEEAPVAQIVDPAFDTLMRARTPQPTRSYSPISHQRIVESTYEILDKNGFRVKSGTYRANGLGTVGQANYQIEYGNDPDMGLMMAWQNSYDKSTTFKFAIGAHVFVCANGMVHGDQGAYKRKHTGTAYDEALSQIGFFVANAREHYENLTVAKEKMKEIECGKRWVSELLGRLFFEEDLLNTEQMSIIKKQVDKPTFDYGTGGQTGWDLYNHVTHSLKTSHPSKWMKNHALSHEFFVNQFGLNRRKISTNIFVELPELV